MEFSELWLKTDWERLKDRFGNSKNLPSLFEQCFVVSVSSQRPAIAQLLDGLIDHFFIMSGFASDSRVWCQRNGSVDPVSRETYIL